MSTGELRKCIVARALVHPVKAILLDEPTVGLDIKAQQDFISMMRSLANSGTTVILVTHHIEEVFKEINKAVLIKDGKIYAQGPSNEVLNSANLSKIFDIPINLAINDDKYSIHPKE
ncbi:MAG: ABC transporter ATP-binding protein, partial [Sulfurovaceae bacterium]|nr:ABC transporter ATP-binding protein [Sulfurovaceae bacterium]